MKKITLALLCVCTLASIAFAGSKNAAAGRSLSEKFGVGFNSSVQDLPALAVRYWLIDVAGIEGFLGFKIDDNHANKNRYVVGGKFLYVIKSYKKLNVFSIASLALHRENKTFGIISGGLGIEWFVLDDLSLCTEAGLSFSAGGAGGTTSLKTNVENIPKISVKYYL
ncbi:MAG: hypothetical protein LBS61_00295 [Endomicrobium sp.]|jgi:hypothetical protein|nr:hypothetical protein [Endomicrobium sp.]